MSKSHIENANHKDALDLFKGLFFNVLGMILKSGKVLFIFIAAHYYNATALGLYFLAWSTVDISSKLGLWGTDKNLVREIARLKTAPGKERNQLILDIIFYNVRLATILSIVVAVLVYFASPLISRLVFHDPDLASPMRLLAIAIPFIVLTLVFISTTKALRQMQYETFIRQGLEPAVLLLVALVLIPLHPGAAGLAVAHLSASVVAATASFIVVMRKFYYRGWRPRPLPKPVRKETWRYTSPLAATDFINLVVARTDIVLVGALLNSTSAGFYGIAVEIISVIKRVRQGFEPIFAPIVSELFHSGQNQRLRRNYQMVTRWLMAGSLLPVIAIFLFPGQILAFFNIHSSQAASALMVLALAHGVFGTFSAAESLLVMSGKSLLNFYLGALMLAVNLTAGLLLIPAFGLIGAAAATFLASLTVSFARIYHGYRTMRLLPFGRTLLWPLFTALSIALLIYLIKSWLQTTTLLETVVTFAVLFVSYVLLYFWGAKESEEKFLRKKVWSKLREGFSR